MMNQRSQRGATLIIVLVVLLLITIVGTLAIRQSLVSLNIATNGQAQQLMIQNSDAATLNVEDLSKLDRQLAADGMFGYMSADARRGKELVFCYRGRTQSSFFSWSNASIMQWKDGATAPDGTEIGSQGYCSYSTSTTDYTSGRDAVMTQIAVQFIAIDDSSKPLSGMIEGTDTDTTSIPDPKRAIVHTISFMPSLSSASATDINNCLSTKMSSPIVPTGVIASTGATQSVSECLAALNVPFVTHVTEYLLNYPI